MERISVFGRSVTGELANKGQGVTFPKERDHYDQASKVISNEELFFITLAGVEY